MKKRRVIVIVLIIFALWSLYRYISYLPSSIDDFVAKPILWLVPVFFSLFFDEKRTVSSIGLSSKNMIRNSGIGILVGVLLSGELAISYVLRYHGHIINQNFTGIVLSGTILSSFATATVEEIVFRGYIQTRILEISRNLPIALGLSSCLFTLIHLPLIIFTLHYHISQMIPYGFLLFLLGVINGFLYAKTKTLAASIAAHTVWDIVSSIVT